MRTRSANGQANVFRPKPNGSAPRAATPNLRCIHGVTSLLPADGEVHRLSMAFWLSPIPSHREPPRQRSHLPAPAEVVVVVVAAPRNVRPTLCPPDLRKSV